MVVFLGQIFLDDKSFLLLNYETSAHVQIPNKCTLLARVVLIKH